MKEAEGPNMIEQATTHKKNDFTTRIDKRHLTWCHSASADQLHACFSVGIPAAKYIEDKLPSEKQIQVDPAVKLGDIGEMYVANILRTRYGENSVTVASASAASADIHLNVYSASSNQCSDTIVRCSDTVVRSSGGRETSIIIEVKKYATSIATTEVEKFRRDISISSHCAGLFVSLTSTISRMDEFNIIYEKSATRLIPCIYLHSSDPNMICTSVAILTNLSKASEELANFSGNRSAEIRDNLNVITRMRDELNAATSAYFSKVGKINAEIACAQSNISQIMRSDFTSDVLFAPQFSFAAKTGGANAIDANTDEKTDNKATKRNILAAFDNYSGYSLDTKRILGDIIEIIEKQGNTDINGIARRSQKNSLVYDRAAITFNKTPVIIINTKEKTIDTIDYTASMMFGATLTPEYISLPVTIASFDLIAKLLRV